MRPAGEGVVPQQHVAFAQVGVGPGCHRGVVGPHRRIDAVDQQPAALVHEQEQVRGGKAQPLAAGRRHAVVVAQGWRVGHRIARAVDDVKAMPSPAVRFIPDILAVVEFASHVIDQQALYPLDQLQRQPRPRLAPGGVGERLARQVPHRGAGDVAVGDLPREQRQRLTRCENGLPEGMMCRASQRIDVIGNKLPAVLLHASQRQIERSHPWPPGEECGA